MAAFNIGSASLKKGPVVFITTSTSFIAFTKASLSVTSMPMPDVFSERSEANFFAADSFKSPTKMASTAGCLIRE